MCRRRGTRNCDVERQRATFECGRGNCGLPNEKRERRIGSCNKKSRTFAPPFLPLFAAGLLGLEGSPPVFAVFCERVVAASPSGARFLPWGRVRWLGTRREQRTTCLPLDR